MYIANYNQIAVPDKTLQLGDELIVKVLPQLAQRYNFGNADRTSGRVGFALRKQMGYVLAALSNNLDDATILDLGCGHNLSEEERTNPNIGRQQEPWLCRALHDLGAKVIGIDYGNLDGELFEHYQTDLLRQGLPSEISDNFIDLANAYNLFSSFRIKYIEGKSDEAKERLIPQLGRIVKNDGSFIYLE